MQVTDEIWTKLLHGGRWRVFAIAIACQRCIVIVHVVAQAWRKA